MEVVVMISRHVIGQPLRRTREGLEALAEPRRRRRQLDGFHLDVSALS